ncbi:MAG: urease subunit beta [Chloroflexi bacterium]|nr:urease subunit beta [Chloroflexota bacterium]
MTPGEILPAPGAITLNAGRPVVDLEVENRADRPIQVGSHFHFYEVNAGLAFDRQAAYGRRLDIASGTAVRFEPGERRIVALIPFGGRRVVFGFDGRVNGRLAD